MLILSGTFFSPKHQNKTAISPLLKTDSSSKKRASPSVFALPNSCCFSDAEKLNSVLLLLFFPNLDLLMYADPPPPLRKQRREKIATGFRPAAETSGVGERKGKASVFMRGGCRLLRFSYENINFASVLTEGTLLVPSNGRHC